MPQISDYLTHTLRDLDGLVSFREMSTPLIPQKRQVTPSRCYKRVTFSPFKLNSINIASKTFANSDIIPNFAQKFPLDKQTSW